jgi:acyl transferase domain-containing protein
MIVREDRLPTAADEITRWVFPDEPWLLAWSAPDERAEERLRRRIGDQLRDGEPWTLAEIARQLEEHRDPDHPVRGACVLGSGVPAGSGWALERPPHRIDGRAPRPVALLFGGHGSQHPMMATQLYGTEPVFTHAMGELFGPLGTDGDRLRADWLAGHPVDAAERGQPLLLALGYALGRTLQSWGVRPTALLGHSIGEVAAATVAGVLSMSDAAGLMATRTAAYRYAMPGGLLAVAGSTEELAPFLFGDVCVGVVNGPRQTMLAGPASELRDVADRLRSAGRTCVPARIPLPFHSPVLQPLAAVSEAALAKVELRPPDIDIYSTITARRLTHREAVDPGFLAAQVWRPVLFAPALDALLADQDVLLVEAGPARALTALARRHPAVEAGRSAVVAMLPGSAGRRGADRAAVLETAATLWLEGHQPHWPAVQHRVRLASPRGRVDSTRRWNGGPDPWVGDISQVPE